MTKLITIVSLALVVTASSLRIAAADDETRAQGKPDAILLKTSQPNLPVLSLDIAPQVVEFEGFIQYGTNPPTLIPLKVVTSDLQKLINERDQLKQRLLEVKTLIRKHAKE